MRLINVHTKRLETFYPDPKEAYAILSHTWGREDDELSFKDMQRLETCDGARRAKLDHSCEQACKEGINWIWIDTCCIDKTSAVELSEAINSMFRWYKNSTICYAYLSDVKLAQSDSIRESRWFRRGWTLQELLAPRKVAFFDSSWNSLGTRSSLSDSIGEATGIPHKILTGIETNLNTCSVAQRMAWASRRTTTRHEDMAYCLLGIFGVTISPIYGEGLERAFGRLQEAIMRETADDSILAWSLGSVDDLEDSESSPLLSGGVLATSPSAFERCGDIASRHHSETRVHSTTGISGGTMPIRLSIIQTLPSLQRCPADVVYGLLSCGPSNLSSFVAIIPLVLETPAGRTTPIYIRPRGRSTVCIPKPSSIPPPQDIMIRNDRVGDVDVSDDKSHWLYLRPEPRYPWNARIDEAYPPESFESDMAMIKTPKAEEIEKDKTVFLVRFRYSLPMPNAVDTATGYFVLGLEYFRESATGQQEPMPYLYFDDEPPTPLSTVAPFCRSLICSGTTEITDELVPKVTLSVSIGREIINRHPLWVVNLSCDPSQKMRISMYPPGSPRIAEQIGFYNKSYGLMKCIWNEAKESQQWKRYRDRLSHSNKEIHATQVEVDQVTAEIAALTETLGSLQVKLQDQQQTNANLRDKAQDCAARVTALSAEMEEINRSPTVARLSPNSLLSDPRQELARRLETDGVMQYIMQKTPADVVGGVDSVWVPGMTLLMYAAATGKLTFVKRILRYDSDMEAMDSRGRRARQWAHQAGLDITEFVQLVEEWKGSAEEVSKPSPGPEPQTEHVPPKQQRERESESAQSSSHSAKVREPDSPQARDEHLANPNRGSQPASTSHRKPPRNGAARVMQSPKPLYPPPNIHRSRKPSTESSLGEEHSTSGWSKLSTAFGVLGRRKTATKPSELSRESESFQTRAPSRPPPGVQNGCSNDASEHSKKPSVGSQRGSFLLLSPQITDGSAHDEVSTQPSVESSDPLWDPHDPMERQTSQRTAEGSDQESDGEGKKKAEKNFFKKLLEEANKAEKTRVEERRRQPRKEADVKSSGKSKGSGSREWFKELEGATGSSVGTSVGQGANMQPTRFL
ncbi:hypothetical protein QBC44DRAFT_333807 [Cladorrhinum sp. PSN332]|nr:hypothetical protein QBC44DRAFT_333807 [Cladorrhinum sp. PSN332]